MIWHSIKNLRRSHLNEITAEVEIGSDSPWFSGHFPGEPILPGIAQLAIIFEAIERSADKQLAVTGISRVKFRQIIRPHDHLSLIVSAVKNDLGSSAFRLMAGDELACRGTMFTIERAGLKTTTNS